MNMAESEQDTKREAELLAEQEHLRQQVTRLQQDSHDLHLALLTTSEHGDLIERELRETNLNLQAEVAERKLAQATLQEILEVISRDKADLEMILQATAEHGDVLEYQLYTQAVETIRQSELLFRAIAESTPILMILTQQQDGAITYANSISVNRLLGEGRSLLGHKIEEFFLYPEDAIAIQTGVETQGYVRNYEVRVRDRDDHPFWVSTSVQPLLLSGESILLTTLYDISDRKQMEAERKQAEAALSRLNQDLERLVQLRTTELQQTEAKYRSIFENAAEGIFQTAPDGHYLSANPALAELYGYDSPDELIANVTNVSQQLYVQPRRRDELNAYLKRFDSVSGFESQACRKDGSVIWISESVRVIRDASGEVNHYEGTVRDITDLKTTEEELRQQRQLSERLLLNILPQRIAERLKRGQTTIADSFADATVLFADLVGFTRLATELSPAELVSLLNQIFSRFDKLVDRHRVEKVKTIGDAYMAVGGVPHSQGNHVAAIANLALEMQQAIGKFITPDQHPMTLRIGIHTGAVVAGVIGSRKFIYDLWGDAVNVASRMESQGEAGRIQVTEAVYNRLHRNYQFEPRGAIEVKGKGAMTTYWLLGACRRSSFSGIPDCL